MDAPPAQTIDRDFACAGCGYNLRSLSIDSICPECSKSVHESIRVAREQQARLLCNADPRWLRELVEGLVLSLCTSVFSVGLALAPHWLFDWKSPQRVAALAIACTMWVFGSLAVWKLARSELGSTVRPSAFQRVLRWSCGAYFSMPILFAISDQIRHSIYADAMIVPYLAALLGGVITCTLFVIQMGFLALRARCRWLTVLFFIMALPNAVLMLSQVLLQLGESPLDHDRSSLKFLTTTFLPQIGPPRLLQNVLQLIGNKYQFHPIPVMFLAVPAILFILQALLWVVFLKLRDTKTDDFTSRLPDDVENTPASSHP